MNKIVKYLYVIILLLFPFCQANAESSITMTGYVIYMGGNLYFSPIDNIGNSSIYRALNEKAFFLGGAGENLDILADCITQLEDSIIVDLYDVRNGSVLKDENCKYFYCEIKLLFAIKSNADIHISDMPNFIISYKSVKYNFNSLFLRNQVVAIHPIDINVQNIFAKYLHRVGYLKPDYMILSQ